MEHTYTNVTLSNPAFPDLPPLYIKCLADIGALMMSITETMANQLQLPEF